MAQAFDGSFPITVGTGRATVVYVLPGFTPPETDRARGLRTSDPRQARADVLGSTLAGYTTYVTTATTAELQALAQPECPLSSITKTVTGSVAGVGAEYGFGVALATSLAIGEPGGAGTFTLPDVADGPHDLLAARLSFTETTSDDFAVAPNKIIVRRGLNPAPGAVLPVLDFSGSEAFDPASAVATITSTNGRPIELSSMFLTDNGTVTFLGVDAIGVATSRPFYGLPTGRLIPGDMHAIVVDDDRGRSAMLFMRDVAARAIALGPEMPPPLVDVYSKPPLRLRAVLSNLGPPETQYGGSFEVTFTQASSQRALVFSYSRGAIGTSNNVEVRTPVLTGLAGWNEASFAIQSGGLVAWTIDAWSLATPVVPADGLLLRSATFGGTFVP